MQEQIDLEAQAFALGAEAYDTRVARMRDTSAAGTTPAGSSIIRELLPMVASAVIELVDGPAYRSLSGAGGRTASGVRAIAALDPHKVALVGLTVTTNAALGSTRASVRSVTKAAGVLIEEELWASDLQDRSPRAFAKLFKRVKDQEGGRRLRLLTMKTLATRAGLEVEPWTDVERVQVGGLVLDAVMAVTDLFTIDYEGEGPRNRHSVLSLTEAGLARVAQVDASERLRQPVLPVMLCPPVPWTSPIDGGYLTPRLRRKATLMRARSHKHREALVSAVDKGIAQPALDAINAIQSVPLRIDQPILELVQWAYDQGLPIKKLPRRDLLPVPEMPEGVTGRAAIYWRDRIKAAQKVNLGRLAMRGTFAQDMEQAQALVNRDFYLPHCFDFRGRLNPLPVFSHHRADYVRAMIRFARAKPLGAHGMKWLKVHVANTGDFPIGPGRKASKGSFQERLDWVEANGELIGATALTPRDDRRWLDADQPFAFVQACQELVEAEVMEGWGLEHKSSLPIPLDASCSGTQHYAMATRSRADASLVNLTPAPQPADLYGTVAETVAWAVSADAMVGTPLAPLWLGYGVTRSVLKRNVMTYGYGSETYGMGEQLTKDLMEPLDGKVIEGALAQHPFGDQGTRAARYLAARTYEAVVETIPDTAAAMAWIKDVAGELAKAGHDVLWYSPTGLPILHRYEERGGKRVELFLSDRTFSTDGGKRRLQVRLDEELPDAKIKVSKQKSALPPNLIHSCDGAHLQLVALASRREGIEDFLMIHDAFATTAGDTERFARILSEQLVSMYQHYSPFDQLQSWASSLLPPEALSKIGPAPIRGTLDYSEVLQAPFAFS